MPLSAFSIVVCRNPRDGKFLLVQEFASVGFWFPGGRIDRGETFTAAALRECVEEAGVAINLIGVLKVEHRVTDTYRVMRVFFLAQPRPDSRPAKTIPDYESAGAVWATVDELAHLPLRDPEPLSWFRRVADGTCPIMPLGMLEDFFSSN
jgi:8-oxo-dGTP pyrophosphatase MutT (NUDIX family)